VNLLRQIRCISAEKIHELVIKNEKLSINTREEHLQAEETASKL
jgi:hypothetical protein